MRTLVFSVVFLALVSCGASSRVVGGSTTIEKSSKVVPQTTTHTTTTFPDGTHTQAVVQTERASELITRANAVGPESQIVGEKFENKITGEPPRLDIGGDTAEGGAFSSLSKITGSGGKLGLFVVGGLMIAGGIAAAAYLRVVSLGIVVAGAGFVVLLAGAYPTLMLWLGVVLVLGLVVYAAWSGRLLAVQRHALGAVTSAVSQAPNAQELRRSVSAHVTPAHERIILNAKHVWKSNP